MLRCGMSPIYFSSHFVLPNASLLSLRADLDRFTRAGTSAPALAFGPEPREVDIGRHTITTTGGMTRGNAGGYFEVDDRYVDDENVRRRCVWRIAQRPSSAKVRVQVIGEADRQRQLDEGRHWTRHFGLVADWADAHGIESKLGARLDRLGIVADERALSECFQLIRAPRRRHGVIVVTRDYYTKEPNVDPNELAAWLTGFAYVRFVDEDYTRDLTEMLGGRAFQCFGGAARIYAPGYDDPGASPSYRNPFFDRDELLAAAADGTLRERFFEAALARQRENFTQVGDTFREQRRLLARERDADAPPERSPEATELALADAESVNADLHAEVARLRRRVDALEADRDAGAGQRARDLVDVLREYLGDHDHVELWSTALRAAAERASTQFRPDDVEAAFRAIADYAEKLAVSDDFRLGYSPFRFFHLRKLHYKPNESATTMGQYGDRRRFTHEGQTRTVESHLTLASNTDYCIHVYFEADPEARVVRVVYVGRHLPTPTGGHNN